MKSNLRNFLSRKLSIKNNGSEQDFLESYRTVLFGQFASMSRKIADSSAEAEAQRVIHMLPDQIQWEDLYSLELAMLRLQPADELRRQAWSLRNEYEEIAASDEWDDYKASNPPEFGGPSGVVVPVADEAPLRADLVRLQQEIHWRYIVMWAFEDYRSSVTLWSWFGGLIAVIVFTALGLIGNRLWPVHSFEWKLLSLVGALGVMGGLTSTLRRIQKLSWSGNADTDIAKLGGSLSVYLSPCLGGVFAVLLFFLIAGKLMDGSFFPTLNLGDCVHDGLACPSGADFAKLVVWSFVAGFAEQLVPDNLARLAGEKPEQK
jgi:hypothetical protein